MARTALDQGCILRFVEEADIAGKMEEEGNLQEGKREDVSAAAGSVAGQVYQVRWTWGRSLQAAPSEADSLDYTQEHLRIAEVAAIAAAVAAALVAEVVADLLADDSPAKDPAQPELQAKLEQEQSPATAV